MTKKCKSILVHSLRESRANFQGYISHSQTYKLYLISNHQLIILYRYMLTQKKKNKIVKNTYVQISIHKHTRCVSQ